MNARVKAVLLACIVVFIVLQGVFDIKRSKVIRPGNAQADQDLMRNEPDEVSPIGNVESSFNLTKKYLIAVHKSGLNNYIRALADAAYLLAQMNDTSITLLIHPNIQNAHSKSRAFTNGGRGKILFPMISERSLQFSELFQLPTRSLHTVVHRDNGNATTSVTNNFRLNYEMATPKLLRSLVKETSSNRSTFKIGNCWRETNIVEQKSKEFIKCIARNFRDDAQLVALHMLSAKNLGVENVPDLQPSLYEMIYATFHTQNGIDIRESTIMVHLRLGDFKEYCKERIHCYFDMADVEPHILQLQNTTGAKHVLIMTNPIPKFKRDNDPTIAIIRKHPDWHLSMDMIIQSKSIPRRMKQDTNAFLVLEMAAAISSKYFVGNRISTVARSIALLRKRQNKAQSTSISFTTLVGVPGCFQCADLFV